MTTIFALSSGALPAGIAVVRISGPEAGAVLQSLTARLLPVARKASLSRFFAEDGTLIDRGLALWFPGPASVTGENLVELHLHGGRAIVAVLFERLMRIDGLRLAEPGEFTRRAFENGRIDLTEAEGLSELLSAETEAQRRAAIALTTGGLGRLIADWQAALTTLSGALEAAIDFSDEDDVIEQPQARQRIAIEAVKRVMNDRLCDPPAERLHNGLRVVIVGPPNVGKSTLFNALVGRDAAIVSAHAGTTRDAIEVPVDFGGFPLLFVDTAGLRAETDDPVERIGMARARQQAMAADIVLALAPGFVADTAAVIAVAAKADIQTSGPGWRVSAQTGFGIADLKTEIVRVAQTLLPPIDRPALNQRHRAAIADALIELDAAQLTEDDLVVAEHLRLARRALGRVTGGGDVEDMLDALFGTFCVGK